MYRDVNKSRDLGIQPSHKSAGHTMCQPGVLVEDARCFLLT